MNMIDCASRLRTTDCVNLLNNGITHVGRYLPTSTWKGLTKDEVDIIKGSGLNLISIFESGATKASYFTKDQGVKDAYQSYSLAQGLGQPEGTAIYFTVDFDAQVNDFAGILNYFQGLKDTLKCYKIGAYGKYEVIQLLQSKGLANYYWQTYAWSSGQHAKGIHLFQYKNDISQFNLGFNIDLDQVENPICGSWNDPKQVGFITQIQVLCETDVRENPDHASGYIGNASKDQIFNVTKIGNSWYQVAYTDSQKGWIDGQNVVDLSKATPSKTKTYKIQEGQTLTKIASIFHTTLQNLLILNPNITNPNKVYAGQTIIVPNN